MDQKKILPLLLISLFFSFEILATESLYDPYMPEPLSPDAPQWMRAIEKNPSGVNFNEMERLYQEWRLSPQQQTEITGVEGLERGKHRMKYNNPQHNYKQKFDSRINNKFKK